MSGLRVQITGAQHPHNGEFAVIVSTTEAKRMGRDLRVLTEGRLVSLENCAHGVECCYLWPGEFRTVCDQRS